MKSVLSVVCILTMVLLGFGCNREPSAPEPSPALAPVPPPLSPAPVPDEPTKPAPVPAASPIAEPTPPPAKEAPAPPVPAEKAAAPEHPPYDANLIPNASLEMKDESGRPNGWIVSPPAIIDAKATGDAADGKSYLPLKGVKDSWGIVAVPIPRASDMVERTLRIAANGMAPAASKMSVALVCKVNGKEKEIAKIYWPKTGDKWRKLEFTAAIPKSADPDSVLVRVLLAKGAGSGYALDGFGAGIDVLGPLGGGLDIVDDAGRPRGWIASPAGVLAQGETLPPDKDRHAIALRPQEKVWGVLAHNLRLEKSDLGRTLVFAATGYAEGANNLRIVVRGDVDGKQTDLASEWWPATDGHWRQVVLRVALPDKLDPATAQVRFEVRQGAKGIYGIDDVQIGF